MKELNTFKLIDRIGILLRAEERKKYAAIGLQPVHAQVLEYLSICNSYSKTLVAVAEYLNLTKGTVSQTLQLLEKKGYITKLQDQEDRRIIHLLISPAGQEVIEKFRPIDFFEHAENEVPLQCASSINEMLKKSLISLQKTNQVRSFGVCHTCKYFSIEENYFNCRGSNHIIDRNEVNNICREHLI